MSAMMFSWMAMEVARCRPLLCDAAAADRAVAAVQDGLSEAQGVIAPAPTPFDRPY